MTDLEWFIVQFQSLAVETAFLMLATSGPMYLIFWVWRPEFLRRHRVPQRRPERKARPLKEAIMTYVNMLAFIIPYGVPLYIERTTGYTVRYENIDDYGWPYFFFSIFLMLLIVDAEFFWMHLWFHRYKGRAHDHHLVHHQFTNPTPWAGFAFNYIETLAYVLLYLPIFLFLPWHPWTIFAMQTITLLWNAQLHLGYTPFPSWWETNFFTRRLMTSIQHCAHHRDLDHNFGLYFSHWDKWMGTEKLWRQPEIETAPPVQARASLSR